MKSQPAELKNKLNEKPKKPLNIVKIRSSQKSVNMKYDECRVSLEYWLTRLYRDKSVSIFVMALASVLARRYRINRIHYVRQQNIIAETCLWNSKLNWSYWLVTLGVSWYSLCLQLQCLVVGVRLGLNVIGSDIHVQQTIWNPSPRVLYVLL